MMQLRELFVIENGISTTGLEIEASRTEEAVRFLRPASTQQRTLSGWIERESVPKGKLWPTGTLFVSTNGEGSHSYAYVSRFEFSANSDVSVLLPKRPMSLLEKLYYARCITSNRWLFSYGRKPKGDRLETIELPAAAPLWVNEFDIEAAIADACKDVAYAAAPVGGGLPDGELDSSYVAKKHVQLSTIFDVRNGLASSKVVVKPRFFPGSLPYIRPAKTMQRTIAGWVDETSVPVGHIYPEGTLFVSTDGEGSHSYSYVSRMRFIPNSNVAVLVPLRPMKDIEKVFYARCISMSRWLFSYGRKPKGDRLKKLSVPSRVPAWVMETAFEQIVDDIRLDFRSQGQDLAAVDGI